MRNIRIALLALALTVIAMPTVSQAAGLGVAGNYNVFVFGSFTASNSDAEGRVAVGGSASFSSYSVASARPENNTYDGLVVGGALSYNNGEIHGNARVGGSVSGSGYTVKGGAMYPNAVVPIDFNAAKTYMQNLSGTLSTLQATGNVSNDYGGLVLTGDGTTNAQVFNIDGSSLTSSIWGIKALNNVAVGTTIIINISGTSVDFNLAMQALDAHSQYVIFNFYEATDLTLEYQSIEGSILAPFADVTGKGGNLDGTLIANSFDGATEFHDNTFKGDLPTPIPGAVWLLGTGLLGLVGLRRKFHN
jgi:choice-of-anchor A domain-containing protein